MTIIDFLNHRPPGEFLKQIEKFPYPQEEQLLDLSTFVVQILSQMMLSFLDPIKTVGRMISSFVVYHTQVFQSDFLTPKSILDQKYPKEAEEKLLYILEQTDQLAKKMGIAGRVGVILNKNHGLVINARQVYKLNMVIFGAHALTKASKEELTFIIAHELSHIKHYDDVKHELFDWIVLGLYALAFWQFNWKRAWLATMVIKGIATVGGGMITRSQERRADLEAMCYLNSNEQAIQFIFKALVSNLQLKNTKKIEYLKNDTNFCDIEYKDFDRVDLTSQGNDRNDFSHPPLTERLAYILNFHPEPS